MADPNYASVPQAFTFGGQSYVGRMVGYSGRRPRRSAVHELLKRPGARVEDMQRGPQRLDMQLEFIGADCANQYANFVRFVDQNPFGLLVHPTYGKFQAFCEGPTEDVVLDRAVNQINVRCSWVESNIGVAEVAQDIPSPPAAAQAVTAQQTAFQQATAKYMGVVAQGFLRLASAQAAVQSAMANVELVSDPISLIHTAVSTAVGATSAAIGAIASIEAQAVALGQAVTNFIGSAQDIFDGNSETTPGGSDAVTTLLGQVVTQGEATNDAFIAASPTPAGAADAVSANEQLVATCYVLSAALAASRPPVINYTVTELTDVVSLCVKLFPTGNALAQASIVLGLNRIPNPAAIRPGMVLRVPSE